MNYQFLINKLGKIENKVIELCQGETDLYFYFPTLGEGEYLKLSDRELNMLYDNTEEYYKRYEEAKLLDGGALERYLEPLEPIEIVAYYLFDLIEQGYDDEDGDVHLLAALASCSTELWKEEIA